MQVSLAYLFPNSNSYVCQVHFYSRLIFLPSSTGYFVYIFQAFISIFPYATISAHESGLICKSGFRFACAALYIFHGTNFIVSLPIKMLEVIIWK